MHRHDRLNMRPDEIQSEYEIVRQSGAAFDVSARTRIKVAGRDRVNVINNVCTAALKGLTDGSGAEAFVLDVKGHVMGHVAIYIQPDELWLETVPHQAETLIKHIQQYVVSEQVTFEDCSDTTCSILVCGPSQRQLNAEFEIHLDKRLACQRVAYYEHRLLVCQSDLIGPPGLLLICGTSDQDVLMRLLQSFGVRFLSPELLEVFRIENGVPTFGTDFDSKNLPQEISRNQQAISFSKGCYLGQETVARLDALGHVNRRLVRLLFHSRTVPPKDYRIEVDGKAVARVTSASFSPSYNMPVALAIVRSSVDTPGTNFNTEFGAATVEELVSEPKLK